MKRGTMRVRDISPDECLIAVEALPEIFHPEDHLDDPMDVAYAHSAELDGNEWRWCMVKVAVWFGPVVGTAGAGCVSCENEAEFKAGPLYADLVDRAIAEIRENIRSLLAKLDHAPEGVAR